MDKMSEDGNLVHEFPRSLYSKGTSLLEFNLAAAMQNLYAQTDFLMRHQDKRDGDIEESLAAIRAQLDSVGKGLDSSNSSSEAKSESQASQATPVVVKPAVIPSAITDMMRQSELKIMKLESIVYSLQDKIVKQEGELESTTRELQRSLDQCRKDRSADLTIIAELRTKLQQCENFTATHIDIRSDVKREVVEMGTAMRAEIAEVSRDMSGFSALNKRLSERIHLMEGRLVVTESQIQNTFETTEYVSLQTASNQTSISELSSHLEKIAAEKASRRELSYKADLSLIMTKVDISEVSKFEDALHELQRRQTTMRVESQDAVNALEKTFLKKQESIAMWCVRKVRKELAQEGGESDIGRVKCLVCDQVVKQAKEQEMVGSGPVYSNTMRPKRQQSAGRKRRGDSPVGVGALASSVPEELRQGGKKTHDIKLTPVKQQARVLSMQAGDWSAQLEEREFVPISAEAQFSRVAMSTKQTHSQDYFKELEMKFARGDYVRSSRPLSAV